MFLFLKRNRDSYLTVKLKIISHASFFISVFGCDQIFYRSYVNRQHFRLRSIALFVLSSGSYILNLTLAIKSELYFTYESRNTLKSFALSISVKTITKLNPEHKNLK